MARKNGCPTNIRDWQIEILNRMGAEDRWVRVAGLDTMIRTAESETAEGSAGVDLWSEPYVTKRSVQLKLSGKPVGCAATGEIDPGQALLNSYARAEGCEEDASMRFVDPYGQAMEADFVVTGTEREENAGGSGVSWELRQVGEAEMLPYILVRGVALDPAQAALRVGEETEARLVFTPEQPSNRRFRIRLEGRQHIAVSGITAEGFTVRGLSAGEAAIIVTTMNGKKTARMAVTVEE